MKAKGIRIVSVAKSIGKSRQMAFYIINSGSPKYAPIIANIIGCQPFDILIPQGARFRLRTPEGFSINDDQKVTRK